VIKLSGYSITSSAWKVSLIAIFTALTAVATISFSVSVPATRGYFNIGETMIYVAALLFGASIGGLSAGFGSMIADLALGYAVYAPATLVVKGLEGAFVGFLASRNPYRKLSPRSSEIISIIAAISFAFMVYLIGSTYYSGKIEVSFAWPILSLGFEVNIPNLFWMLLSAIAAITILYISLKQDPYLSWQIISILIGGSVMVIGYFFYQQLILGVVAIVEIPINIGQMIIGAIIAIPLVRAIKTRMPKILSHT
jgi:uncharacterized membrane protein